MDFSSNIVTNIISGLALLVSSITVILYFLDRKHAKYAIKTEYINNLLSWHGETIEILIRLSMTTDLRNQEQRNNDLCHLSALIEKGRFFFPNITKKNSYGTEKPIAYRGYRNLALDGNPPVFKGSQK